MEKIFHIPHSSVYIPDSYIHEYVISKSELEKEALTLCDIRTNELVDEDSIIFPYSRIFCDVERFNSDKEEMKSIGMGVLYTSTHNLETLRINPSVEILDFYNEHHDKLNKITKEKLETSNEILFIDIHSYSNTPLKYELHKNLSRPDICIGLNERYNKDVIEKIIYTIKEFDYTYSINEPFSGCLLPSDYINDERVNGVMIEINKNVYDNELSFEKLKSFFKCIKEI